MWGYCKQDDTTYTLNKTNRRESVKQATIRRNRKKKRKKKKQYNQMRTYVNNVSTKCVLVIITVVHTTVAVEY